MTDVVRAQSRELREAAKVVRYTRSDGERVYEVRTERFGGGPLPLVAAAVADVSAVTLSLSRVEGVAEIRVRDTGVGIDPELLQHMVQVESAGPGKGSEFLLRLPLAATAMAPRATDNGTLPKAPSARRLRVLVVEDNIDAASSLADLLKTFGHEVQVVHDGPSAIRSACISTPDVVLCDIGLPGMTGYEVAQTPPRFDPLVVIDAHVLPTTCGMPGGAFRSCRQ